MNKLRKKGFTLIELMIVLAIIAILAMVLVPKAGIFKSQSKNSGVYTNVNTVRAYLENKVGDNFIKDIATLTSSLNTAITNETVKNPFSAKSIVTGSSPASDSEAPTVYVASSDLITDTNKTLPKYKGAVVVVYTNNATEQSYKVYGVDSEGNPINPVTVK